MSNLDKCVYPVPFICSGCGANRQYVEYFDGQSFCTHCAHQYGAITEEEYGCDIGINLTVDQQYVRNQTWNGK